MQCCLQEIFDSFDYLEIYNFTDSSRSSYFSKFNPVGRWKIIPLRRMFRMLSNWWNTQNTNTQRSFGFGSKEREGRDSRSAGFNRTVRKSVRIVANSERRNRFSLWLSRQKQFPSAERQRWSFSNFIPLALYSYPSTPPTWKERNSFFFIAVRHFLLSAALGPPVHSFFRSFVRFSRRERLNSSDVLIKSYDSLFCVV